MRTFAALLAILFWCATGFAQTKQYPGASFPVSAELTTVETLTCTSNTSWGTLSADSIKIGDASARTFVTSSNVFEYSWTLCTLAFYLHRTGTGTPGNLTAEIRSDNAGAPGTVLSRSLNTVGPATITNTNDTWAIFTFAGQSLTNGSIYWFGLTNDTISATDYYVERAGSSSSGQTDSSAAGSTWSAASTRKWYQSGWSLGALVFPPATNSFELLMNMESGSDGGVTLARLTNSFKSTTPFSNGHWTLSSGDATSNALSFVSMQQQTFPSNYWWLNVTNADTGTRSLAISHSETNSRSAQWTFGGTWPNVSFGYYAIENLTNSTPQQMWADEFALLGPIGGANDGVVQWLAEQQAYRAHATSNNVAQYGGPIVGVTLGNTNWVTGQYSNGLFTIAVYNPVTWAQIGTNSVVTNAVYDRTAFYFSSWAHATAQAGITNYYDNLVIKTNALFPIIPTNFPAMNHP